MYFSLFTSAAIRIEFDDYDLDDKLNCAHI